MKKVVISGSSRLVDRVDYWTTHFKSKGYEVLDYPKLISDKYVEELPIIYEEFYNNLEKTDVYFMMNEEKNGIRGYIGSSAISELTYVVIQNLIHNKNI